MLKLKTLEIIKYLDVEPTILRFHDKRNVLLGKNGSGKTTLLKLISMILRGDLSELAKTEFEIRFSLQDGEHSLDAWVKNSPIELPQASIPGAPSTPRLFPTISFDAEAEVRYQDVRQGQEIIAKTHSGITWVGSPHGEGGRTLPGQTSPVTDTYLPILFTAVFGWFPRMGLFATRLDEELQYFNRILGEHAVPMVTRQFADGEMLVGLASAPGLFLRAIASQQAPMSSLSFQSGKGLRFLNQFVALTHFQSAELRFDVEDTYQQPTGGNEGTVTVHVFSKPVLYCTRADGRRFDHNKLSFGQQRLWSILYYLACNPTSFIADEMVNGLHHEWIEACLDELGDRQAFLTSQNPLLFDFLSFTSPEDVQQQFVLCSLDEQDPRRRMHWRQMSDEKAYEFYQAYLTGMQRVSETLLTEGLW